MLRGLSGSLSGTFRLKHGRYLLDARKGDRVLEHRMVTVERGGIQVVKVGQPPAIAQRGPDAPTA